MYVALVLGLAECILDGVQQPLKSRLLLFLNSPQAVPFSGAVLVLGLAALAARRSNSLGVQHDGIEDAGAASG